MKTSALSRERWERLEPLLDAALELEEPFRSSFINRECGEDELLCAELRDLVLACERGYGMLGEPASVAFGPLMTEPDTPTIPTQLGAYPLVREIGRGGMATVYLAEDPKHGRQVAVKVLHAELARRIGRDRFMREIEIAASLTHPHILPLHDSGEACGDGAAECGDASILFFVSPFASGESLRDLIQREHRVDASTVAQLGREIALALDYAHRQGVIHLDIKPENVLLQEGHAVIADFGIARAMSKADDATADTSLILGTPWYMSPEQATGAPADIDGRSDIYSLGCVLFEMLTGHRPFAGISFAARLSSAAENNLDARLNAADVPEELSAVIRRAMSSSRDDRFSTANDLAVALSDSVREKQPAAPIWRSRLVAGSVPTIMLAVAIAAAPQRDRLMRVFSSAPAPVAAKSIAVLPFANVSPDGAQDYLADGLRQDVVHLLAKSPDLRVATHTAAWKNTSEPFDARSIARQLRVAYLLRGKVARSDSTIRVSAELIRAVDGTTIWTETYDRRLSEILVIQHEIADHAAKALQTTSLATALTANLTPRAAASYNLVLRGRYFLNQATSANLANAVEYFKQAIAEEPQNAPAYAALARAYRVQAGEGWLQVDTGYALSRAAAERAVAIDPRLAEGYEALAYIASAYDWDWDAAERNYSRALELEPGNAEVLRSVALLMTKLGRYNEAIIGLRKAIDRDPFVGSYSNLSYVLGAAGSWDESEAAARTALALGPNTVLRHFNLARALVFQNRYREALKEVELEKGDNWRLVGEGMVYHALGRDAESDRALAECAAKFATHAAMQIADAYAYRGDIDVAFAWLRRAYAQRDPGIADIANDPWLFRLRGDPRYAALLQRLRLAR